MVSEGDVLWTPPADFSAAAGLRAFMGWLDATRGLAFPDYEALRAWSVADVRAFWGALWDWAEVASDTPYTEVLNDYGDDMMNAKWFAGARVNYAEHVLRAGADDDVALSHESELRPAGEMTRAALRAAVRRLATSLRERGVRPGDKVVSYMPNIPETAIAMLAVTAIGAVWSSAAPEFGARMVIERFGQITPKVMFATDGYRYGGKDFDRREEVAEIAAALPSLEHVIFLPYLNSTSPLPEAAGTILWQDILAGPPVAAADFRFARVPSDHPLWVLFSSGTTGVPKAVVHGHAGMLIEHFKNMAFHAGLRPGARLLFYSTTGWMMWNVLIGALMTGAAAILYDGHPVHPDPGLLWRLAERHGATCFGASPTFVQIMQKARLRPAQSFDLSRLESILLSGSPASPECFAWFYEEVKPDLWVTSQSGGTEIASAFVGAVPTLPVRAGEIQARCLGMDVHAWSDAGEEVVDAVGEMVVCQPFPSMPLYFCNDPGGARYRKSYFQHFPGIWRHGDFIRINARGGCFIQGRSDATLNRFGVRIGTAEIYRAVEGLDGIADSLVVCCEWPDGSFFMPLFVRLSACAPLDDHARRDIVQRLREDCSPRHVPDAIFAVPAIPYTLTGKKMELPVRRLLMGEPEHKAVSRGAMANPEALDWFLKHAPGLAKERQTYSPG